MSMQGQFNFGGSGVRLQPFPGPGQQQDGIVNISGPLFIDTATIGEIIELQANGSANQCFTNSYGTTSVLAMPTIRSIDVAEPIVSGVLLESGSAGDKRRAGTIYGSVYKSNVTVMAPYPYQIWLGQSGEITGILPTLAAGDLWLVKLGEIIYWDIAETIFRWAPERPIKL